MNVLGVDVGGTFTDAVLLAEGELRTAKVPTARRQEESVLAAAAAVGAGEVERFTHGTTVADIVLTLAPRVRLFSADVFGPQGSCDVEVVIKALRWAVEVWKCKVINLSLGVTENRLQQLPRRQQFQRAVEEAYFKCQSSLATVYQRNLAETSGSLTNCTSVTSRTRTRSTPSGGRCSNLLQLATPLPSTERPAPRQLCILPPVNFPS